MKLIPLTQNKFAIVDDEDYLNLIKYKWHADYRHGTWYAKRTVRYKKEKTVIFMHRQIMNVPLGLETDHINHNGLDNRKKNLRICTRAQNQYNRKKLANRSSKYKGVSLNKSAKKWQAQIVHKGKFVYLGLFQNEIIAAKTYDEKAKKLFGDFAYTNF